MILGCNMRECVVDVFIEGLERVCVFERGMDRRGCAMREKDSTREQRARGEGEERKRGREGRERGRIRQRFRRGNCNRRIEHDLD
jgi:hypothetical protein